MVGLYTNADFGLMGCSVMYCSILDTTVVNVLVGFEAGFTHSSITFFIHITSAVAELYCSLRAVKMDCTKALTFSGHLQKRVD